MTSSANIEQNNIVEEKPNTKAKRVQKRSKKTIQNEN
jgi:hypothetical protein